MNMSVPLVVTILRSPETLRSLSLAEWDMLVRQASAANLMAKIGVLISRLDVEVPDQVEWYFAAANQIAERQLHNVRYEVGRLQEVLNVQFLISV